jgi:hypothetical protein
MKTMQGAFFFACSNKSRTRLAPTPTNISTNSEPEIEKKGVPASPATALARRVLPVPGGPTSNTPLGILAPTAVKRSGFLRKSTTSVSSSLAPSIPATSLNSNYLFTAIWSVLHPPDGNVGNYSTVSTQWVLKEDGLTAMRQSSVLSSVNLQNCLRYIAGVKKQKEAEASKNKQAL